MPGNDAKQYPLALQKMQDGMYSCRASETLPLDIIRQVVDKDGKQRITVTLKALENVYFNYGEQIKTGYKHSDCQFYMPVFWYRRNLRSPKEAPSFHTSDSWLVREDRLSTPLTAAFKEIEAEMSSGAAFAAPAPVMPTKSITPKNNLFSLIVTSVLLLLYN